MVVLGEMLTDWHINATQSALKRQFSKSNRLESTLYQIKKAVLSEATYGKKKLQIVHCKKQQHWIVSTTINSRSNGKEKIFDSIFRSLDKETKQVLLNLFGYHDKVEPKLKPLKSQKQY